MNQKKLPVIRIALGFGFGGLAAYFLSKVIIFLKRRKCISKLH